MMSPSVSLIILILGFNLLPIFAQIGSLRDLTISQLEGARREIDRETRTLAEPSLRTGVGAIGHRSMRHKSSNGKEWVEVNLGKVCIIDEIILVPNIYRDSQKGFLADGFPAEFRVLTGVLPGEEGAVLGEFGNTSSVIDSVAPYVIDGKGVRASWVRIEVTRLTQRAFNKHSNEHYIFQLAEMLVFSGAENVALHRPVKASSEYPELNTSAWSKRFLVDGHTPYIMNAAEGRQSVAFLSELNQSPVLKMDLGKVLPITRIHLHAIDQSDTVPQAYAGNYGVPPHFQIEGAKSSDFSDAEVLLNFKSVEKHKIGPIMMWNIPKKESRYIRLVNKNPSDTTQMGFAEIQLFSHNKNVALGKQVTSAGGVLVNRSLKALTDGHNLYGEILPLRDWLNQLARRQELRSQRPKIVRELAGRYESQRIFLQRITWLAFFLFLGAIMLVWIGHVLRQRAVSQTRERIAANLHDELGANLHAIGLLGDYAKRIVSCKGAEEEWGELNEVIDEVRVLTEETGETARYCTNLLESKEIHANLVEEMKRTTKRLLSDLEYEAVFTEEESLYSLKPRRRIDLYLFYKECLTNLIRHSGATYVSVELSVTSGDLKFMVTDNGHGYEGEDAPASLCRRAKMLGGRVHIERVEPAGMCVVLQLSLQSENLIKRFI